ncbi:MAG: ArsI/CadI family heavy metal resistance metalloenzyme [Candidatus Nanopelagicales bacterium]
MSRVQLALNVADLEQSVNFYSKLLGVAPHKRREGYANFAVQDPPLKMVLIENPDAAGTINHLGVEVADPNEVRVAIDRLNAQDLATREEIATVCCYAQQDKVWVDDPEGTSWEVYTVTDDDPASVTVDGCCTPTTLSLAETPTACC